jgi:hypothetical protein
MNAREKKRLFELFTSQSADSLEPSEQFELQELLRHDADARSLWFLHQDIEIGLRMHIFTEENTSAKSTTVAAQGIAWHQWRPLTAAAAGLLVGLFSASMVFGFVVQRGAEKRVPLPVFEPGFENPTMLLESGFLSATGRWSGDAAEVVKAERGVSPRQGNFMLRLEPVNKGAARIYQVLDLQSVFSSAGTESMEIEISASFAAADPDTSARYAIRAFAVTEAPQELDAAWFERRDESIASVARGLDVAGGVKGWQTVSVRIQVPRAARSLVLFLGARTPDKSARIVPHYLDDVRVSIISAGPLP